jgi:LacI family transcriptional regulator
VRGEPFTALVAFNDVSAIGAVCALREGGFSVPQDVSVVGVDDIQSAAYQNPALTTVRQPLHHMGLLAAEAIVARLGKACQPPQPNTIQVSPELITRETTTRARPESPCDEVGAVQSGRPRSGNTVAERVIRVASGPLRPSLPSH